MGGIIALPDSGFPDNLAIVGACSPHFVSKVLALTFFSGDEFLKSCEYGLIWE